MKKLISISLTFVSIFVLCLLLSGCRKIPDKKYRPSFTSTGDISIVTVKQEGTTCVFEYSVKPDSEIMEYVNADLFEVIYPVEITADGYDKDGNIHSYKTSPSSTTIDFTSEGQGTVEVLDVDTENLKQLNVNFTYNISEVKASMLALTWMFEEP